MSFLMWMKKQQKRDDKVGEIARNILAYGKPEARKPTLDDWKEHLRSQKKVVDLATKRGLTRLYKEYEAAA